MKVRGLRVNLPAAGARAGTQVPLALPPDSRDAACAVVAQAAAQGGRTPNPSKDHGFMPQHGFCDPDGHTWGESWVDPAAVPPIA